MRAYSLTAQARRVGFMQGYLYADKLNSDGWDLFDTAIDWARWSLIWIHGLESTNP